MNKIKLVVLILLYSSNAFAQELTSNVILTDQLKERNEVSFLNPVLTWDDFKGTAPKNSEWTAMTYSGIKLRYEYKVWKGEKSVSIMLYPYMDQSKSWYSQAGYNAHTLSHEQLHFDITILLTYQLSQKLQNMQLSSKSYGRQINTVHDEYLDKLKNLQDQYDEETNHGINRLKQREWSRKITLELKKFTE